LLSKRRIEQDNPPETEPEKNNNSKKNRNPAKKNVNKYSTCRGDGRQK